MNVNKRFFVLLFLFTPCFAWSQGELLSGSGAYCPGTRVTHAIQGVNCGSYPYWWTTWTITGADNRIVTTLTGENQTSVVAEWRSSGTITCKFTLKDESGNCKENTSGTQFAEVVVYRSSKLFARASVPDGSILCSDEMVRFSSSAYCNDCEWQVKVGDGFFSSFANVSGNKTAAEYSGADATFGEPHYFRLIDRICSNITTTSDVLGPITFYAEAPEILNVTPNSPECPSTSGSVEIGHARDTRTDATFFYTLTRYLKTPDCDQTEENLLSQTKLDLSDGAFGLELEAGFEYCPEHSNVFSHLFDGLNYNITLTTGDELTDTTGNNFSILPGIYELKIESDSAACFKTYYFEIPEANYSPVQLESVAQVGTPLCSGDVGSVEINLSGGKDGYNWILKNSGNQTVAMDESASSTILTPNVLYANEDYVLEVTDLCYTKTFGGVRLETDGPPLIPLASGVSPTCLDGSPNGSISAQVTNVAGKTYSYTLFNSNDIEIAKAEGVENTYVFSDLAPDYYYVEVTASECDEQRSVGNVELSSPTQLAFTSVASPADCSNGTDGQLEVTEIVRTNGDINFRYEITSQGNLVTDGIRTNNSNFVASDELPAGTYALKIVDRCLNDAEQIVLFEINSPMGISVDPIDSEKLACFDDESSVPLTWNNAGLDYNIGPFDVTLAKNGIIFLSTTTSSSNIASPQLSVDTVNQYLLTVVDGCGESSSASFKISTDANGPLFASFVLPEYSNGKNVTCKERNDGRAIVTVTGGVAGGGGTAGFIIELLKDEIPYVDNIAPNTKGIVFSDPVITNDKYDFEISGLSPGVTYSFRVIDYNSNPASCAYQTATFKLSSPDALVIQPPDINADFENGVINQIDQLLYLKCKSDNNIDFTSYVSGGNGPYSISILHAGANESAYPYSTIENVADGIGRFSNLKAGSYTIQVKDELACAFDEQSFVIEESPEPLELAFEAYDGFIHGKNTRCYETDDARITLTATGGITPYSYKMTGTDGSERSMLSKASQTHIFSNVPAIIRSVPESPITYSVFLTDALGCEWDVAMPDRDITLNAPEKLSFITNIVSPTAGDYEILCKGDVATLAFESSGGSYPHVMVVNDEITEETDESQQFDSLIYSAGTFTFKVVDADDCESSEVSITLDEPPTDVAINVIDVVPPSCIGGYDGKITVAAEGGVQGTKGQEYFFLIRRKGAIEFEIDTLKGTVVTFQRPANEYTSATYVIGVWDVNQCYAEIEVSLPANPDPLRLQLLETVSPSCFGASNGSIELEASDASGSDLTFYLTGGHLKDSIASLAVSDVTTVKFGSLHGTDIGDNSPYEAWVEDSNHCARMADQFIDQIILSSPEKIHLVGNATRPSCFGAADGSIAVTLEGGVPPYLFSVDDSLYHVLSADKILVDSLPTGDYNIYVRDSGFDSTQSVCKSEEQYIVDHGRLLSIDASITNVLCKGGNDGAILLDLQVANRNSNEAIDTARLLVRWTNDEISSQSFSNALDLTGLERGTYSVDVEYNLDSTRCVNSETFIVSEPASELRVSNIKTYPASCGSSIDGRAVVSVAGGWPGKLMYFSIDNQPWTLFNSDNFLARNLAPGDHEVSISQGPMFTCISTSTFQISRMSLPLTLLESNSPTCPGANDGFVIIDGGQNVGYVNIGTDTLAVDGLFSNLAAAEYKFLAISLADSGCMSHTLKISITDPTDCGDGPLLASIISIRPATCATADDGFAELAGSRGVPPYTYFWNGDINASSPQRDNLSVGLHVVDVYDAIGSRERIHLDIEMLDSLSVQILTDKASCTASCDGVAEIIGDGGSGDLKVEWFTQDGDSTFRINDLCPGWYSCKLIDRYNDACHIIDSAYVGVIDSMMIEKVELSHPICAGSEDGSIAIDVLGGSGSYRYEWSDSSTSNILRNQRAGMYSVAITDDILACEMRRTFYLSDPPPLMASANDIQAPSCAGGSDGSATLTLLNADNPLVQWSNSQVGVHADNLKAGVYGYAVTSALGCEVKGNITIPERASISSVISVVNEQCYNSCDATISLGVSGGAAPYSIIWSNGSRGNSLTNLCEGAYGYRIRDRNGCVYDSLVEIVSPAQITISGDASDPSCYGFSDGRIVTTAEGGTGLLSRQWTNGSQDAEIAGLSRGRYSLRVEDENGCVAEKSFVLSQPTLLSIQTLSIHPPSCADATDASIEAGASGGSPGYMFSWSNGNIGSSLNNLGGGLYMLTVTDKNNCSSSRTFEIIPPSVLDVSNIDIVHPLCARESSGSISLSADGGTPPYRYLWNTGSTISTIENATAGLYDVIVSDANGCMFTNSFSLIEPQELSVSGIPSEIVACTGSVVNVGPPDGAWHRYEWTGPSGFFSANNEIQTTLGGKYKMTVWNEAGCNVSDDFNIIISSSAMQPDFLRLSSAVAFEPIVFVDISFPIPEQSQWIIPDDTDVIVNERTPNFLEVVFNRTGEFEIGFVASLGTCEASIFKVLTIDQANNDDENSGREKGNSENDVKLNAFPNPTAGQLNVEISAPEFTPIEVKLISADNRVARSEVLEGRTRYLVRWDTQALIPGVYHLVCLYDNKIESKKVIVIK